MVFDWGQNQKVTKQLDLQSLINSGSKKQKRNYRLFKKHFVKAKVSATKGGNKPNAVGSAEKLKDQKMPYRLSNIKYIIDNDISRIVEICNGDLDAFIWKYLLIIYRYIVPCIKIIQYLTKK